MFTSRKLIEGNDSRIELNVSQISKISLIKITKEAKIIIDSIITIIMRTFSMLFTVVESELSKFFSA